MKTGTILQLKPVEIFLWGCLILFTAIICAYGVVPSLNNTKGDFANYYTASRLVRDGVSVERAYHDFVWFQKQMDRYGIQNQVGGFIPHPPPTALVFLPISFFSPVTAKNIWTLINVGLIFLNIILLFRITRLDWLTTAVLFLGTGYGLLNNILFGQLYLLVLTSILLGLYLAQRDRLVLAGVSLGSLILVKYVGIVFVAYYAWRRRWRLVVASVFTVLVVFGLTVLLADLQSLRTFCLEVLPRHLNGEIQDPFSVYFQSWNSLFRRLFLFEETVNPNPPFASLLTFVLLKYLVFWVLLSVTVLVLRYSKFDNQNHKELFRLGLIPCALLLISPANTTYYFLLLTFTVVAFVKILLDQERTHAAFAVGALFFVVNLPHFMKLRQFADGWLTPLVYSRLWLLLIFFVVSLVIFRESVRINLKSLVVAACSVMVLVSTSTVLGVRSFDEAPLDESQWIRVDHPEFNRHLGALLKDPDVGREKIVFSYCELLDDRYAIYAADGQRWTLSMTQNFYDPDLAPNDSTLLMVTIWNGRPEIWLSPRREQLPVFVTSGESPSWHPNGRDYAFVRDGRVFLAGPDSQDGEAVSETENCYDVTFSAKGDFLSFCSEKAREFRLHVYDLAAEEEEEVLISSERLSSPTWSGQQDKIVFSWQRNHNRDIWALDLATRRLIRLTRHPAADTSPVWDSFHQRIIFVSDRGRGLEFSALYWIPIPEERTQL